MIVMMSGLCQSQHASKLIHIIIIISRYSNQTFFKEPLRFEIGARKCFLNKLAQWEPLVFYCHNNKVNSLNLVFTLQHYLPRTNLQPRCSNSEARFHFCSVSLLRRCLQLHRLVASLVLSQNWDD